MPKKYKSLQKIPTKKLKSQNSPQNTKHKNPAAEGGSKISKTDPNRAVKLKNTASVTLFQKNDY